MFVHETDIAQPLVSKHCLPSQSLGTVLKKLNLTQQKHTYTNKL